MFCWFSQTLGLNTVFLFAFPLVSRFLDVWFECRIILDGSKSKPSKHSEMFVFECRVILDGSKSSKKSSKSG